MLNRRALRLIGGLLSAVYIALPGGAVGVRPCEHHGAAQAHADTDSHAASAEHAKHAGHAGHAEPAHAADHDEHGSCSCFGVCAPAGAVALAAAGYAPSSFEQLAEPRATAVPADAPRQRLVAFLLPWSTAPPSGSIV
jgi:hypothetical protein